LNYLILPQLYPQNALSKVLKKYQLKRSDIKEIYYGNGKTLLILKKRVKSKLWEKASKEEVEEIIFLHRFVQRYSYLIDQERRAEVEATLEEIKSLSGVERELFGRAVLNLKGSREPSRLNLYFVKFGRSKPITTDISAGDVVLVSKGEPLKSDLQGTVAEVKRNFITIAFEQKPPKWVYGEGIRVDLYINDVTFKRMEENLKILQHTPTLARDIALELKAPPPPKKVEFTPKTSLNPTQQEAVSLALESEAFLIHGPPGTGKTSTLIEIILQLKGKKVLAVADSNTAVDNILQRLAKYKDLSLVRVGHPARILYELEEFSIHAKYEKSLEAKAIKEGWEQVGILVKRRDEYSKPTPARTRGMSFERILTLEKKGSTQRGLSLATIKSMAQWIRLNQKVEELVSSLRKREEQVYKKLLKEADVVLSTNAMVMSELLKSEIFDVAVIDEGSQQMIPSTLIPIMHAKRFIIAGDHKQLPPTVVSEERELKISLFEKLIPTLPSSMLRIQYRMNEKIMNFSNQQFYQGKLIAHPSVKDKTIADLNLKPPSHLQEILDPTPVVFVDIQGEERLGERSKSYFNLEEANLTKEIVEELLEMGAKDIGVITPYNAQVKLIKKMLEDRLEEGVEVKSVDGFQGREKEIVVISFVRSNSEGNIGFLKDLRRLNVALTRAKKKLICIGDGSTLATDETYNALIKYISQEGKIIKEIASGND